MLKVTCAAVLVCATSMANAEEALSPYEQRGFQFGAAFGRSGVVTTIEDVDGSSSANSFGYKLFGGYRFNQYLALEGTWEDAQALEDSYDGGTAETVSIDDDVSFRVKPKVYGASVIGSWPFAEVYYAFARVGMSHWETNFTSTVGTDSTRFRDKGDDLKWGIGLAGKLDGALIRVEYEEMNVDVNTIPTLPLDLKLRQISLGVAWLF